MNTERGTSESCTVKQPSYCQMTSTYALFKPASGAEWNRNRQGRMLNQQSPEGDMSVNTELPKSEDSLPSMGFNP